MTLKAKLKDMLKNIENTINSTEDFIFEESADINNLKWKNEDKYNEYIDFLVELSKKQGIVKSGMFDDSPEKLEKYSVEEFHVLFELFERAISAYAIENFIEDKFDMDKDSYLEESCIVVKIKNNYYKVDSYVGANPYITFREELNFIPSHNNYIDYELLIHNRKSSKYEETIKELIHEDLDDIKDKIEASDVSLDLFIEALREYLDIYNK